MWVWEGTSSSHGCTRSMPCTMTSLRWVGWSQQPAHPKGRKASRRRVMKTSLEVWLTDYSNGMHLRKETSECYFSTFVFHKESPCMMFILSRIMCRYTKYSFQVGKLVSELINFCVNRKLHFLWSFTTRLLWRVFMEVPHMPDALVEKLVMVGEQGTESVVAAALTLRDTACWRPLSSRPALQTLSLLATLENDAVSSSD